MKLRAILTFAMLASLLGAACSLSDRTPGYCGSDLDCPSGTRCKLDSPKKNSCVAKTDASADAPDATEPDASNDADARDSHADTTPSDVPCTAGVCSAAVPICDSVSKTCRACTGGAECSTLNAATPACVSGKCVACGASGDCKSASHPVCDTGSDTCRACGSGAECMTLSAATPVCLPAGGCVECSKHSDCVGPTKPICDSTSNACRACGSGTECAARSATTPACSSAGACVECVANTDCKIAAKPICNTSANACRPCQADAECPADPGVCLGDGHCAGTNEVIFVEFNVGGCPGADGSSGKPYCAPNDAVTALTTGRHVIVIRGAANNQLTLGTSGVAPVIIGRKNSAGIDGSILAGASTSVTVSSDNVLLRDLIVNAGTTPTSEGIAATGSSTKLTLLRITASLGMGLGIDAKSGALLTMDRCLVQNNSAGGVLINGASYSIQNSILAGNGYGVKFSASAISSGSQFSFNTVVGSGGGATCDPGNPQVLANSIVLGLNDSCTLTNCLTNSPTFSASKPYHLTGHLACPTAPAAFPDHDFDGDPRTAPVDCGADQFVP